MFIVRIDDTKTRRFSTRKSARSYSRRAIRRGANFVAIFVRANDDDATNETNENDVLANVYRARIDDETRVRSFVRIDVNEFRAYVNAITRNENDAKSRKTK
jgi:hypothetical protein